MNPNSTDDRQVDEHDTQPAEEWGERVETGRDVAQGGQADQCVEGATDKDADDPRGDADCEPEDEND